MGQQTRPGDRAAVDDPFNRGQVHVNTTDDWGYRGNGRVGGGHNGDSGYLQDYPTAEVHDAIDANARATFARGQYHRLQDSLNQAIRLRQYNFEHSGDLADALKQEQQAWQDYVSARNAALRGVVDDPKYQSAVSLKNDLGERIAETREEFQGTKLSNDPKVAAATTRAQMRELVAMASVKLDYAQVATDMEVAALKNDSKVADARHRLMDAGSRVQALRDDFDHKLRNDQELASLRSKIEDARIASATAESYRNGAVGAANQALDYAYYKNRFSNSYAGYGYPYGYGYGVGYGVAP
jgi:hypothetical protein